MLFGLRNVLGMFQRFVNDTFQGLLDQFVVI